MADKTYISTVKLPNDNTTYYIKDAEAIKGSGTSGNLVKWNGTSTVTDGPTITSGGTGFLKQDGTWATPTDTNTWRGIEVEGTTLSGTTPNLRAINFIGKGSVGITGLAGVPGIPDSSDTITITGTNTWRRITVSGTSWKGKGTDTGDLNIVGGTNVTVTGATDGNDLTISATDTNRAIQVNGTTFLNTTTSSPINFIAGSNITLGTSGDDLTINAQLPGGGMQFQGVVNATGTSTAEQIIKAKTNQNKGSVWLADDTGLEWIAIEDVGGTASASSWEAMGGRYGNMAYCDTGTASYQPAGTVTVTPTTATGRVFAPSYQGGQAVVTLPSHADDTFTQGSFTQGTFSQGTLPSCTLPVLTTGVSNEVLTIGWSAGSFSAGTLPSHAADSFTKPTFTQGTFSAGTTAPLAGGTFVTGISSATFTGTTAMITVSPATT